MSLRHAILGFLSVRPLSGYDLKKAFDASVAHFWQADQAQIYRTLAGLADAGLVAAETIAQTERPDRKLHHLTGTGRAELEAWLRAPTAPTPRREPFLVKLFFASTAAPDALLPLVDAELAAAEAELATLRAVAAANTPGWQHGAAPPLGPLLSLWNGLAVVRAHRDWLRAVRALLAAEGAAAPRVVGALLELQDG